MGRVLLNQEFSPLYLECIHGAPEIAEIEKIWDRDNACFERGQRYASITDLSAAKLPSKEFRVAQQQQLKECRDGYAAYAMGSVLIVPSPTLRVATNIILALSPPPIPQKVVGSIEEGIQTVLEYMKDYEVELPDAERCIQAMYEAREQPEEK